MVVVFGRMIGMLAVVMVLFIVVDRFWCSIIIWERMFVDNGNRLFNEFLNVFEVGVFFCIVEGKGYVVCICLFGVADVVYVGFWYIG